MNKKVLKSSIATIALGMGVLAAPYSLEAAATAAANPTDECAKELLLSYFPEPIINETLKKFKVPEDKFAGINKSLSSKDKEIVKLVEQKAAAMNPNPLKDPQQRQAAVKLFRETLLQVFSEALKDNGVLDSTQYQAMLDDIQQQKAKKFAMCMEKQKESLKQSQTNQNSSNDDNDDDEDEDSDDEDEDSDSSTKNHAANKDHNTIGKDKQNIKTDVNSSPDSK